MSRSNSAATYVLLSLATIAAGCVVSAKSEFFGKTTPPPQNVLRYVSGSEPESLDPQIPTGQPEARICMALYSGLTEYDPKTTVPIPDLAERWEANKDASEFTFHIRHGARFSNGDPITARDFVYTIRRGLSPELAARNASLAYYIKYAEGYNEGGVFVRDSNGQFLLEKDFTETDQAKEPLTAKPVKSVAEEYGAVKGEQTPDADTSFHRFMHSPDRVVLPGDEKGRKKALDANPRLKAAIAGNKFVTPEDIRERLKDIGLIPEDIAKINPWELEAVLGKLILDRDTLLVVQVRPLDLGVEAVDDYTLRVCLTQPAPFFLSLMPHQFFRVVNQRTIKKFGNTWTDPQNIVTSGPFKLAAHRPYDRVVVVRDPMYWDAATVKLDSITFFALDDNTTIMNLYKAGEIDGMLNHSVPAPWLDLIQPLKDFMDAPEAAIEFYLLNTTTGPTKDVRVRKALNMAIDKQALANWRHVKPLTALTPEGIFPGYPQPKGDQFDPQKAKQLLADAGYKDASGKFDSKKFPVDQVELTFNPAGANQQVAEFVQAQWKQNLGLTISLKTMEFKTFLVAQSKLDYKGIARSGWVADYMDPFNFLWLYYTPTGNNGTGWWDQRYVDLLDEANRQTDQQKRYELIAKAEAMALEAQPVIPLTTNATRWMKKPYVKGMYPNPQTLHAWKYVYIERDPSKWDRGVPDMSH